MATTCKVIKWQIQRNLWKMSEDPSEPYITKFNFKIGKQYLVTLTHLYSNTEEYNVMDTFHFLYISFCLYFKVFMTADSRFCSIGSTLNGCHQKWMWTETLRVLNFQVYRSNSPHLMRIVTPGTLSLLPINDKDLY